jgi:two-component system chemotaxis sensor kinase CheA
MFQYAQELILQPINNTDLSGNYYIWKAFPEIEKIPFSGSDVQKVGVKFSIFEDTTKDSKISLWAYGDGTQDLLMLRQEFIPIVRLYKLFKITPKYERLEDGMLIVVKSGNQKIAVFIDEFLHQHQVVVKPLDKNFKPVMGIGAATVRGDGSIGLILDIVGLIQVQKDFDHGHLKAENTNKKVS